MRAIWTGAVVALCLGGATAQAAEDPQTGRWSIDLARSKYVTAALPKSSEVTITPDGADGISLAVTQVNAAGQTLTIRYSAQYDGKPYPRTEIGAGAVPGQTVALRRVGPRSVERVVYLAGKPVGTEVWTISADGGTRTVVQSGVDRLGKPIDNLQIYVRR